MNRVYNRCSRFNRFDSLDLIESDKDDAELMQDDTVRSRRHLARGAWAPGILEGAAMLGIIAPGVSTWGIIALGVSTRVS